MSATVQMTPITAIRNFFGMKPGQTLPEFKKELDAIGDAAAKEAFAKEVKAQMIKNGTNTPEDFAF